MAATATPSSAVVSAPAAPRAPWRRAQAAVVLAFALIGANALLQAWQAHRLERARIVDTEIVEAAGQQSRLTQRIGRLAAQIAIRPESAAEKSVLLERELEQSRLDALRADERLRALLQRDGDGKRAVEAWQDARERLWYRAEALLRRVDAGESHGLQAAQAPPPVAGAESSGTAVSTQALADAVEAVQSEADRAAHAAQALVAQLGSQTRAQMRAGLDTARVGAVITWTLLALLGFAVVAPAVRAARRQSERLGEQLRENAKLALVAEHTGNLVIITDDKRRIVWTNEAFTRHTGYELHEVSGRTPSSFLLCEHTDLAAVARLKATLDQGRAMRMELLNRSKDGREYWIDTDVQPLRDGTGTLTGFLFVETVITEQVTQRLRTAALLAALPTAVVVHGRDGRVLDANRAAHALLGVRSGDGADHVVTLAPLQDDLTPWGPDRLPAVRTLRDRIGLRGEVVGIVDGDGQRRWLHANTQPLADALGAPAGAVACYVDMSERRRLLEQLRQSARSDALTRLPNRTVVLERVQRAIAHRKRHPEYGFAVLFMDIDRFKQVNDTLGHAAGDELLRQVSERLVETLRPGDAVARVDGGATGSGLAASTSWNGDDGATAARIGGDEFVIVLEGVRHGDDAGVVAQRLLEVLAEPYNVESHPVHTSVSIGVVCAERAADTADAVLRDCDTAMYEAKRAGRGRYVVFDASMHDRVVNALETERDLRRAIDHDELFVVYQPVVLLGSGELAGVEALVRWQHPERGVVMPANFIALAEETGLIDALGAAVLRKACSQFGAWQRELGALAPPLLSVNLSRAQLQRPGLVAAVSDVLRASGMKPSQLQLEVTETLAAQDQAVQATLRELKALGVRLALDDFGTGYSSLACLHQLPVDTVKIDRSFVAHASDVEYHRVLIEATIRVARTLGMTTVAEGIEWAEQASLMEDLRCDRGQGYLFGRPMGAAEFEAWAVREGSDTVA